MPIGAQRQATISLPRPALLAAAHYAPLPVPAHLAGAAGNVLFDAFSHENALPEFS
jgi:hypothetical protein